MKKIIISALYLIILFSLSTFVLDPSHLYYEIWWLDIPMHILGGFGVASLTTSILLYNQKKVTYWKLLIVFLIVALAWELYEYLNDVVSYREWNGVFDTLKDTVDGIIGMSAAYLFIRK